MNAEEAASFNIAILPDENIEHSAIDLSQKLTKEVDSYFVLDGKNFHPHITVYQAHYPVKNLDKLKQELGNLAKKLKGLEIVMNGFKVSHETFVFWNCDKTEELIAAQKEAIRVANPLREGLILPHLANVGDLSEGDKEDIKNYGSLLIGPRYEPHATITRIKKSNDASRVQGILGEVKAVSFRPDSLVLAHLAEHGTLTKIIERVSL